MTVLASAERFTEAGRRPSPWRRWLAVAAIVVVAAAAVWAVWFSALLSVREVRVLGTQAVPSDEVRTAAAVRVGEPLARVDVEGIVERVGAIPAVGSVEVRRGWPDVLVVVVTERVPLAVVRSAGSLQYVDATGARFGALAATPASLPFVRSAGETSLRSALGVLSALPAQERGRVVSVVAGSRDDVVLRLRSGATVQWGSPEDSDRKLAVLLALLPRQADHYDVSAPDLPTTRG